LDPSFERFVAFRYLTGAKGQDGRRGFLRFVTLVAIGGVALGVASLLLALAVVRGFSQEIEAKIVGFGAHVQVESLPDAPLDDAVRLESEIRLDSTVVDVEPVVQEFVLLRRSSSAVDGASLWGANRLPSYVAHRVDGSARLDTLGGSQIPVVLGSGLASNLGIGLGQKVTAFSVRQGPTSGQPSARVKQFVVTGIFHTDLADFDEIYAFVPIQAARDLVSYEADQVTRLDVTLTDPALAGVVALALEERFQYPVMARSIYDVHRSLFAWVDLQEAIIPLVIAVIILVAAFNIVGTLLMIILEKTREVGVLRSMGAGAHRVQGTFLWLGALIGLITVVGELLALGLALIQIKFEIIRLPAEAYFMNVAPVDLSGPDFLVVGVATVILCSLSAYLPARVAARIDPMRAIHFR